MANWSLGGYNETMKSFLGSLFSSKKHILIFSTLFLGLIILTNIKWGYGLLGNDNFSPELDPKITLERNLQNPGWRTYRALGVPSDSEQADTLRAFLFYLLSIAKMPYWAISQVYFFGTLVIAYISAAKVAETILIGKETLHNDDKNASFTLLFGGLFYVSSLLTVWIYYFPVHLFVAAFAFLPLVLWRLLIFAQHKNAHNAFYLSIAALFLGISGLTATMFLVCLMTLIVLGLGLSLVDKRYPKRSMLMGLGLIIVLNLYWLVPFTLYVQSNTAALQDSLINRKITTLQVQNEQKYTVLSHTLRYAFSWIDDRLSTGDYAYLYHDWYNALPLKILGYFPAACAAFGAYLLFKKKKKWGIPVFIIASAGVFLIKGSNPPFGYIYSLVQKVSPIFTQVFRWRSSKFWPLLAVTLPLLATYGAVHLSKKRPFLAPCIAGILCLYMFPLFAGSMVRPSMYTKVPEEYFALSTYLKNHDPDGRIYVAPEANTLYFRNYQWGFFGSVMLNYVLPNPTFEKALIIGSSEGENAFNNIKNTYYSGDYEKFTRTLDTYKVSYVLEDRSVQKGESGYEYDLSINDTMLKENPRMKKRWSQGNLTLYAVDESRSIIEDASIFDFHPDTVTELPHNQLLLSSTMRLHGLYQMSYPEEVVQDSSIMVKRSEDALIIEPAAPRISLDTQDITPQLPVKRMSFPKQQDSIVSINDVVIDQAIQKVLPITFSSIHQATNIRTWQQASIVNLLDTGSTIKLFCDQKPLLQHFTITDSTSLCGSGKYTFSDDTVVEAKLAIESSKPVQLSWCFSSTNMQNCVQNDRFYTIDGKKQITLLIPKVMQTGDSMEMFMNIKPLNVKDQPDVAINNLTWRLYDGKNIDYTFAETPFVPKTDQFKLSGTYPVSLTLADNAEGLSSRFEMSSSLLDGKMNKKSDAFVTDSKEGLALSNTESSTTLHTSLPIVTQDKLILIAKGKHMSGIPADITLRSQKQGAALYENQLYAGKESILYDTLYVPKGNPTLSLDIISRGIGEVASQQTLSLLRAIPLPSSWNKISFVSKESVEDVPTIQAQNYGSGYGIRVDHPSRVLLNTAVSPYWSIRKVQPGSEIHPLRAHMMGTAVHVEKSKEFGWEQGFSIQEPGSYVIVFWPNYLIYAGYGVVVGILGGLGLYSILKKISSQKHGF